MEGTLALKDESLECPPDTCILCYGLSHCSPSNPPPHKFPSKREDSLRRHLIDVHLAHAHNGINCTWSACCNLPKFTEATGFLAHAATVHNYGPHIKSQYLTERPPVKSNDTSSVSSSNTSLRTDSRLGTEMNSIMGLRETSTPPVGAITVSMITKLLLFI